MKNLRQWSKRLLVLLFAVTPSVYVASYGVLRCTKVLVHQSSVDFQYPDHYDGRPIGELRVEGLAEVDLIEVEIYYQSIGRGSRLDDGQRFDALLESFYTPLGAIALICRGISVMEVTTLAGDDPSNDPDIPEEDRYFGSRMGPIRYQQIPNDASVEDYRRS